MLATTLAAVAIAAIALIAVVAGAAVAARHGELGAGNSSALGKGEADGWTRSGRDKVWKIVVRGGGAG